MELYGVALALLRNKEGGFDVACHTIAVPDGVRNGTRVIDSHSFKTSFDMQDPVSRFRVLEKVVNILGSVVLKQMRTLEELELPYRPVSIMAGQHSRDFFNGHALLDKLVLNRQDLPDNMRKEVSTRRVYQRLATVMEKSTIQIGSYTSVSNESLATLANVMEIFLSPSNQSLIKAKPLLGCPKMGYNTLHELCNVAYRHGGKVAKENLFNEHIFGLESGIKDFTDNASIQESFAVYSYTGWNRDVQDSFDLGFKEALAASCNVDLKMQFMPANPYFVDPCALMVKDQLDVLMGRRSEEDIAGRNNTKWQNLIGHSSQMESGLARR